MTYPLVILLFYLNVTKDVVVCKKLISCHIEFVSIQIMNAKIHENFARSDFYNPKFIINTKTNQHLIFSHSIRESVLI